MNRNVQNNCNNLSAYSMSGLLATSRALLKRQGGLSALPEDTQGGSPYWISL